MRTPAGRPRRGRRQGCSAGARVARSRAAQRGRRGPPRGRRPATCLPPPAHPGAIGRAASRRGAPRSAPLVPLRGCATAPDAGRCRAVRHRRRIRFRFPARTRTRARRGRAARHGRLPRSAVPSGKMPADRVCSAGPSGDGTTCEPRAHPSLVANVQALSILPSGGIRSPSPRRSVPCTRTPSPRRS